jgi:hypothetical protein
VLRDIRWPQSAQFVARARNPATQLSELTDVENPGGVEIPGCVKCRGENGGGKVRSQLSREVA